MKKLLLLLLFINIILFADSNEAMLKGLGESSGGAAGAVGLFAIHGFFFGPIILAGATALIIIGVYYRMFTIYKNRNYEIIDEAKFSKLYQYVSFTFRNVLITSVFTDSDYEKFKELALSYEPLKEFSKGLF